MDFFQSRKYILLGLFIIVPLIFLFKLFYIQIVDDSYKYLATNNVIREITVYPARGLIFDRNHKLIVANEPAYDLLVIPKQVTDFDTVLLCRLLELNINDFKSSLRKAFYYSKYKPSIIAKLIPAKTYAVYQESAYKFPGFYTQTRTIRRYPYENAAHILGYINEVTKQQIDASDNYYQSGDYIGISGIEKSYEKILRGERGTKYALVDVYGREQGTFENELFKSKDPIEGQNITTGISIILQQYGEQLMQNKKGSIVAIDPSTGEILALVSSPAYNPTLLTGKDLGTNFASLNNDSLIPLYNRPIMAQYSPGSVFKTVMGLIGLQEKRITPYSIYNSAGAYYISGLVIGDHAPPGPYNLEKAIRLSSNAYFCELFRKIIDQPQYHTTAESFANWKDYLDRMGLGQRLGIDIPNEVKGLTPSVAYYDKIYGKGRWKAPTIISLGIGQGELLLTPLQIANLMAIIGNKGYYKLPHIVKSINGTDDDIDEKYKILHGTLIDKENFDAVIKGMQSVVEEGTARLAQLKGIIVCGKTGTVENPHGADHSIFAAFAPKDTPTIAIAVVVENAGYGATWAAPIASLMMEKYFNDTIANNRLWLEKRIFDANLLSVKHEKKK